MRKTVFVFLCAVIALSCKETPTPPPPPPPPKTPTIAIHVDDVSCTEAWVKVSLTDLIEPRNVAITQDGHAKLTARVTSLDSVFLIENLLPRHTYRFAAQRLRDTIVVDTTGTVPGTTLDTTSHNFSWQFDTLGVSGIFNDVTVINDTLAYAVGEVYQNDTTGQFDPYLYNLAKWNGREWQLKRVTVMFEGNMITLPLEGIFAFSPTSIWLTGSIPIHGDGVNWISYDIQALVGSGATVSHVWGDPNELFFVGRAGSTIRYGSNTWQRLESGTTLQINDIWGANDITSGKSEIYAIASTLTLNEGKKILKVGSLQVASVPDSGLSWSLNSFWFSHRGPYYIAGDGLYHKRDMSTSTPWQLYPIGEVTNYYSFAIRGTAKNDVVVAGDRGEIVHFNGMTWHNYLSQTRMSGWFYAVSIKDNLIIAVGYVQNRGVIAVGKRQS